MTFIGHLKNYNWNQAEGTILNLDSFFVTCIQGVIKRGERKHEKQEEKLRVEEVVIVTLNVCTCGCIDVQCVFIRSFLFSWQLK